jgi:uncharacterized membrane protein YeaQ/YmgE (transglycosylase-associated protein family)
MTLALCVLVGLAVGWVGGRLLVLDHGGGVRGDLTSGVLGALVAGWLTHAAKAGPSDVYLVPVVSGIAGALATTFAHRAHADRFRRAVP